MTELAIYIPDDLEKRARSAGLLSDRIQNLLEDAIRLQTGRRLRTLVESIHATGIAPMSMEENDLEVKAVRAERRARQHRDPGADRS